MLDLPDQPGPSGRRYNTRSTRSITYRLPGTVTDHNSAVDTALRRALGRLTWAPASRGRARSSLTSVPSAFVPSSLPGTSGERRPLSSAQLRNMISPFVPRSFAIGAAIDYAKDSWTCVRGRGSSFARIQSPGASATSAPAGNGGGAAPDDDVDGNVWQAAKDGDFTVLAVHMMKGLDLNKADEQGMTLLHHAALGGHEKFVEMLILGGANVNVAGGSQSRTPLHLAAENLWMKVVDLLIRAGARCDMEDTNGSTPLQLVERYLKVEDASKTRRKRRICSRREPIAKILNNKGKYFCKMCVGAGCHNYNVHRSSSVTTPVLGMICYCTKLGRWECIVHGGFERPARGSVWLSNVQRPCGVPINTLEAPKAHGNTSSTNFGKQLKRGSVWLHQLRPDADITNFLTETVVRRPIKKLKPWTPSDLQSYYTEASENNEAHARSVHNDRDTVTDEAGLLPTEAAAECDSYTLEASEESDNLQSDDDSQDSDTPVEILEQ